MKRSAQPTKVSLIYAPSCDCFVIGRTLPGGKRVEEFTDEAKALKRFRELYWKAADADIRYRTQGVLYALNEVYFAIHCRGRHVIGPK